MFVVLKKVDPEAGAGVGDGALFEAVAEVEAATSQAAIKKHVTDEKLTEGTFAAVSTRNFVPKPIGVEQRVKIG